MRALVLSVVVLVALALAGCELSAFQVGAVTADSLAELGEVVAPELERSCVQPRLRAETDEERASIEARCEPRIAAYKTGRTAHVALRAALVADARGDPVDLRAAIEAAQRAVMELADLIGLLKREDAPP